MSKRRFAPGRVFYVYNKSIDGKNIFPSEEDKWRFLKTVYFFNNGNGFYNLFYEIEKLKEFPPMEAIKRHMESEKDKRKPLVAIAGYCLESDGFHFLLEEKEKGGISRLMQRVATGYTKYFNNKHEREGHLFRGKFKATEVKEKEKMMYLLAYINVIIPGNNPELKDGKEKDRLQRVMEFATDYFWSTHQVYINKREAVITDKEKLEEVFPSPKEYLSYVGSVLRKEA